MHSDILRIYLHSMYYQDYHGTIKTLALVKRVFSIFINLFQNLSIDIYLENFKDSQAISPYRAAVGANLCTPRK